MALQVYTASLLKEGLVAYLTLENGNPSWTPDIRQATAGTDSELEILKLAAEQAEQDNHIVAPYAIDVLETEAGYIASTKREQIRASGPTISLPQDAVRASRKAA
ncbi:DUF2849 domain-containing protein [uncultured Sneathiella sp.]|uniref:DUF2849 domain-containing protein n=1 Tax=uncultured Sneathiella sp. TaxID=879315 RepID=UPI0030D8686E|tara:strand:- start:31732 stop:32046 length:315 start_codon:yes stop_codon:yes gene_type:complete